MPLRKLDHAEYREVYSKKKNGEFPSKNIFSIFMLKTLTGKAVLSSTHTLCFGSKIRQQIYTLYTPVLIYKSRVKGGGSLHEHVFLMQCSRVCLQVMLQTGGT